MAACYVALQLWNWVAILQSAGRRSHSCRPAASAEWSSRGQTFWGPAKQIRHGREGKRRPEHSDFQSPTVTSKVVCSHQHFDACMLTTLCGQCNPVARALLLLEALAFKSSPAEPLWFLPSHLSSRAICPQRKIVWRQGLLLQRGFAAPHGDLKPQLDATEAGEMPTLQWRGALGAWVSTQTLCCTVSLPIFFSFWINACTSVASCGMCESVTLHAWLEDCNLNPGTSPWLPHKLRTLRMLTRSRRWTTSRCSWQAVVHFTTANACKASPHRRRCLHSC